MSDTTRLIMKILVFVVILGFSAAMKAANSAKTITPTKPPRRPDPVPGQGERDMSLADWIEHLRRQASGESARPRELPEADSMSSRNELPATQPLESQAVFQSHIEVDEHRIRADEMSAAREHMRSAPVPSRSNDGRESTAELSGQSSRTAGQSMREAGVKRTRRDLAISAAKLREAIILAEVCGPPRSQRRQRLPLNQH